MRSPSGIGCSLKPELDGNIIKPARREAAIEMTQAGNDDPDYGDLDIGARLIEHQKIEAGTSGDFNAGFRLVAGVFERAELRAQFRLELRCAARNEERIIPQAQGSRSIEEGFLSATAPHQTDRQELVQFGQRAQQGDAAVEMRAGAEFDVLMPVLHPVRYRDIGGNAEIAGDVEHPKPSPGIGKLASQIVDVGIVEPSEVDFFALHAVVPPDGV